MENLINYIQTKVRLSSSDKELIKECFVYEKVPAQTLLLKEGNVERFIYFLEKGIVKGYQNIEGKIVVQHLVEENDVFTSIDSFMSETPADDYFETITDCHVVKVSKKDFNRLQTTTTFWTPFVKEVTNEHLNCKMERVKDFQVLSAKERYLKFVNQHPKLASGVSIDNIASFLGMEPQSLSRIRKQIVF